MLVGCSLQNLDELSEGDPGGGSFGGEGASGDNSAGTSAEGAHHLGTGGTADPGLLLTSPADGSAAMGAGGSATDPLAADAGPEAGLVAAASFEDNAERWSAHGGGLVRRVREDCHQGDGCLRASGREDVWQGPLYGVVSSQLTPGEVYEVSAWVRTSQSGQGILEAPSCDVVELGLYFEGPPVAVDIDIDEFVITR